MILIRLAFCLILVEFALSMNQDTADVSESQVNAKDPSGNTFQGSLDSESSVSGHFDVGGSSGPVDASAVNGGSELKATGPNGEEQTGTVDGNARTGRFLASTGDKVDVVTNPDGSHAEATINDGDKYNVDRPNEDTALVTDPNGQQYKITGIQDQDILVQGAEKPYEAQYKVVQGQGINTRLKEKTFGEFGPAYESNVYVPNNANDGSLKLGVNPFDSGSYKNLLSSVNPSVTVTVDKIKASECPEKVYGDAFGDNGFKIIDDSITVELPPIAEENGLKTYAFPGCFIVHTDITIPANIDPTNVGGQVQAVVAQAGTLQCDKDLECKSNAQNKPDGPCFFCDFCEKDKQHAKAGAVFGDNTEINWNLCEGKPGGVLPLNWKVCPKDSQKAYDVLKTNWFDFRSDIETTIKIFLRKDTGSKPSYCSGFLQLLYPSCKSADSSASWQLVGCRKAVISYKISTGIGTIGNAKSDVGGLIGALGGGRK